MQQYATKMVAGQGTEVKKIKIKIWTKFPIVDGSTFV